METPREFFQKIVSGEIRLDYFVENAVSESQYLEFKRHFVPKGNTNKVAPIFTQFLNSDGGVIVWGIDARECKETRIDEAKQLIPIENPKKFCQDLEAYISINISPPPSGIVHQIVDDKYLVSYVPPGEYRPYQSVTDGIYYFRCGDKKLRMTHQMIVDAVLARKSAEIVLEVGEVEDRYERSGKSYRRISFRIRNISAITNQSLVLFYNSKSRITSGSDNIGGVPDFELDGFYSRRFYKFVRNGSGSAMHPGLSFKFVVELERNDRYGNRVEFCIIISGDNNSSAYHFSYEAKRAYHPDDSFPVVWHRIEKVSYDDAREIFEFERLPTTKLIQYPSSELS